MAQLPPLPAGFTLDQPEIPPLPEGFALDAPRRARPPRDPAVSARLRAQDPATYDPNYKYSRPSAMKAIGGAVAALPETAMAVGTGAVAMPVAGLAGIAAAPFTDNAGAVVERVQGALTYQPQTESGQRFAGQLMYPLDKMAQGADAAGGYVARLTGSPAAGAVVNTGLQALPAVLGRGRVSRGNGSTPSPGRAVAARAPEAPPKAAPQAQRPARLERVSEAAPSIDELAAAKNAAYKAAEETGVVISRQGLNRLKVEIVNDLKKEGIDKDLHPAASAAVRRIVETKGQPTLSELETLRKIANDARTSNNPADARLGSRIIEKIDDFEETLGDADIVSGNTAAATAFREARALNQRLAKARTIQKLLDDAELQAGANYTASGMENALRQQFKSLAKNDKKMRGFTPEERAAIKRVAMGAPLENFLRKAGKFGVDDRFGQLFGLGATAITGGSGILIPIAGTASRSLATRMTVRNARAASDIVRRGPGNAMVKRKDNALVPAQ